MACNIEISEEYRDKYGLPKEMPEAEFYAWLANGGLQQLANDNKLSFSGYQIVDNKFKESLGITKKISEHVKLTVKKLNKMVYGAEEAGSKTGAKSAIETIKELQADARAYLKENKIASSEAIERAIGRIRNEVTYAKFLTTVELQQEKLNHFEKVEKVKALLKKVSKLKKSERLTASNKAFIKNTSFPSSMEVSDLDTYASLLEEYIEKRAKGASNFGSINKKLTEFIEKENAYISSYKSTIASLKEMIDDLVLEEEYESLIKEGVFEDTDIQSFEDYKKFWDRVNNQLEVLDNDEALIARVSSVSKAQEVKTNIETTLNQNKADLKEAFELASTEAMVLDFSLLENADLSVLSFKELVLLSNIIDGVLYDGDFMAYDNNIRSKLAQVQRKKGLISVIEDDGRKIKRLLDLKKERAAAPIPTLIRYAAFGTLSESKLDSFIFGMWNAMVSNVEAMHNAEMLTFETKMKALGSNLLKKSVAIETFAFINQVNEGLTLEEEQAQFKNDTTVFANSAQKLYNQYIESINPTREIELYIKKAKYALEALERFGVITELEFTKEGVSFEFVEGATRESIQGKLDAKEQDFYDFMIDAFARNREDFINGMEIGLGVPYKGIKNYFPRFSKSSINKEDDAADIRDVLSGFSGVSRTQDRAKKRSQAQGEYNIGLREHFSRGLWENMLVAYGQQQINDVITAIYSNKVGIKSLAKDGYIGEVSADTIIKTLITQVKKDLTYGNISLNSEKLIAKELGRLSSSMYYGNVLNTISSYIKQAFPAIFTNFIIQPKTSSLTAEILLKNKVLSDKLIKNTTVVRRNYKNLISPSIKFYPLEYLEGTEKASIKTARNFPVFGDILKTIVINKTRKMFGKEVKTSTLLEYGDSKASTFNIIAGYINYIKIKYKKQTGREASKEYIMSELEKFANLTDVDAIERFDSEAAAAAAEAFQQALNSISAQSQQSKLLSNSAVAQLLYLFKSFQVNTHQEFLKNVRRLWYNKENLTSSEIRETKELALAYVVQQASFRLISSFLAQYTLSAIARGLDDDEEKEKVYLAEKTLTQFLIGIGSDVFLGSAGIFGDVAVVAFSNWWWEQRKEDFVKEIKETDPEFNPKGTPLDPNRKLAIEPSFGGSIYATFEFFSKMSEEWSKEADILNKAGLPTSSMLMYPIFKTIAFLTASGTLRDAATAVDVVQDKEIQKTAIVFSEIVGSDGFQYQFKNSNDLDAVLDDLKQIKPKDIRRHLVLIEEDDKAELYFVPKEKMDKLKKEAVLLLYSLDIDKSKNLYSEIIKNSFFLDTIKNPRIDDAAKKAEAIKQVKAKVNELLKKELVFGGFKKYSLK